MNLVTPGHGPVATTPAAGSDAGEAELRQLFHRLNNQLGIVLAHAELLELKAADDVSRAHAGQVVASALEALTAAKAIRQLTDPSAV